MNTKQTEPADFIERCAIEFGAAVEEHNKLEEQLFRSRGSTKEGVLGERLEDAARRMADLERAIGSSATNSAIGAVAQIGVALTDVGMLKDLRMNITGGHEAYAVECLDRIERCLSSVLSYIERQKHVSLEKLFDGYFGPPKAD